MKRKIKLFVIYFPVILVASQTIVNSLYFIHRETYMEWGFYFATFFGTNVLFSLFLVAFTFMFKFCSISRWAAGAELLFGLYFLIIQKDDVYNVIFQITAGTLAILLTCFHYIRKYPFCRLSLLASFFNSFFKTGSCNKALKDWDEKIAYKLKKQKLNTTR